jgi:filamentous hemagglutinin family protein
MSASNRYSVNLAARPCVARAAPAKRGRWLRSSALGAAGLFALASVPATAAPTGGVVVTGSNGTGNLNNLNAEILGDGTANVVVNQSAQKAVINWSTFSNGVGETIQFNQPNSSAITLNRITGNSSSVINGQLNANGHVWVLNPRGVVIGASGSVNVRGFLGTTHAIQDDENFTKFLAGSYDFTDAAVADGYGNFAEVVNEGTISVGSGYAILAGHEVRNGNGTVARNSNGAELGIFADLGSVVLAGIPTFTLSLDGDRLLSFAVGTGSYGNRSGANPLVNNAGLINASGGKVLLTARAASNIVDSVVNMGGNINAETARVVNGVISLGSTSGTDVSGEIVVDGGNYGLVSIEGARTDAQQSNANIGGVLNVNSRIGAAPGTITVLGGDIGIGTTAPAKLLASAIPGGTSTQAQANGGTISIGRGLIGSPYQDAELANRITIGPQNSSNFANGQAVVEIQARTFGGIGLTGGKIFLYTASGAGDEDAQISTSGFIDVQASGNFQNDGGANGKGGTVEIVTQNFTLKPSGTIIANSVTGGSIGGTNGGGGVGGTIRVAAHRIVTQGDTNAPADTRISASGNVQGGQLFLGGGLNGASAVAGQPLAREIWIGADSSLRASAFDLGSGTTGGKIVVGGATDTTGSSVYIDGGLSARGGNGGVIQTVGTTLQITGSATEADINSIRSGVDAGGYAPGGTNGSWLISGSNLTVKGIVTPETPEFITGVSTSSGIDGRVLGGALGSFLTGPIYGATDIKLVEFRGDPAISSALRIQGPVEISGARDAKLELHSQDEVAITAAINVDPGSGGKLNLVVDSGGDFSFTDDGLQGGGTRSIFTNGGSVSLAAADVVIGADRVIDTSRSSGAGSIDIAATSAVELEAGSALFANAEGGVGAGGTIRIAGQDIYIGNVESSLTTRILAVGTNGGGTISIGGAANGGALLGKPVADYVLVAGAANIEADGLGTANGGRIDIWSNTSGVESSTMIFGKLFARSGLQGGNGGTIEVGGRDVGVRQAGTLNVAGTVNGGELRLIGDRIRVETYDPVESDPPPGLYAWGYAGSGGSIKIGGDVGGTELVAGRGIATEVLIGDGTQVDAGASLTGNGGTITIWSGGTGKTTINGAFIYAGGGLDGGKGGVVQVGGHDVELAYDSDYGVGYGYDTFIDASGSAFRYEGELISEGGSIDIIAANNIRVGEDAALHATGFTTAGRINLAAGTSILLDGLIDASICCSFSPASVSESGFLTKGTGSINLSAGQYIRSRAGAIYGDGNVSITAGRGISLEHRSEYNGDFYEDVPTFIIGNHITLTADALGISRLPFDEPGAEVIATSSLAIQTLTASRNIRAGGNPDPAPTTPSTGSEFVPTGADFAAGSTTLVLDELELDAFEAPAVMLGRSDGTGALSVFFSRDVDDVPDDCGSGCDLDGPSTTTIQMGGAGGTITLFGQEAIDSAERYRFVAGSSITLADDFQMEVNGKLELVSGGSFLNNAGADALTTPTGGQWLIYSADPSVDTFGGLLSGQTAIWGQSFVDVAANGIDHSGNRYAFGLAPTVTVTALNRTKTYGDTLNLASPVLGTDFTVSGLVNAAQFGGAFLQDSITGAPTLASSGSGATANAGSYAIVAGSSSGFATPAGYNLAFQSGVLTVDPRLLTAALTGSTQKVYDATTAASLSGANYSLAGFVNGDGATVGQTSGSFASANVGSSINVTASLGATDFVANAGTALSNYVLPTSASGAIGSITPATLTYVAASASRQRNNPNPPLTGTVTGFVGGETQATATSGALAFATTATTDSPAGTYAINGGGLTAANYVFVQAPGNATALRVQDNVAPAQQVTTEVIQQVISAIRTPTTAPTPTPPPAGTTGLAGGATGSTGLVGAPGSLPAGGSSVVATLPPPPPPPPPLSPPPAGGTNTLPPSGPSVEATPPSPVGDTAPPTPSDSADQGDAVLAEAETEEQDEAPSEKRQLASTSVVVPGVNVEVPTPPRPPEVPGADQSFSGSGNPAQW